MKKEAKEAMEKTVNGAISKLLEFVEDKVPETGRFKPVSVYFRIPLTRNLGLFRFENDLVGSENDRRFAVGALRDGTDRLTSVYLKRGSLSELKEYIASGEGGIEILKALEQASDSTDDFWEGDAP